MLIRAEIGDERVASLPICIEKSNGLEIGNG